MWERGETSSSHTGIGSPLPNVSQLQAKLAQGREARCTSRSPAWHVPTVHTTHSAVTGHYAQLISHVVQGCLAQLPLPLPLPLPPPHQCTSLCSESTTSGLSSPAKAVARWKYPPAVCTASGPKAVEDW